MDKPNYLVKNPQGSIWHRWDPHIHMPGTVLNDQYRDPESEEEFLKKIENSDPKIRVLGITDYYILDSYNKIIKYKNEGRLPEIEFIFPNIELRFMIGAPAGGAINFHLLFSPEDCNHTEEIKRFLNLLQFRSGEDTFLCNKGDLIRLGKKFEPNCYDEKQALEKGANQFKVDINNLKESIDSSGWFKKNALIAIAAGSNDGTSSLRKNSSFTLIREELESMADIIFSSNPKDVEFWRGKKVDEEVGYLSTRGGRKPCLHGSDAHRAEDVGNPDLDRYNWIKGDLIFESLRQTTIEPEERVYIGAEHPVSNISADKISNIKVGNASWFKPPEMPLNPGLVAIIGARGSGKTALADLIATGAYVNAPGTNESSFICRANEFLDQLSITLCWSNNETTTRYIKNPNADDEEEKVQYLSQQFVEKLCSFSGLAQELMKKIEHVIFEAHHPSSKAGAINFQDLLDIKLESVKNDRAAYQQQIAKYSRKFNEWLDKNNNLPNLIKEREKVNKKVKKHSKNLSTLLEKKNDNNFVERYQKIDDAFLKVKAKLNTVAKKLQKLEDLRSKIKQREEVENPEWYESIKMDFKEVELKEQEWKSFQLVFRGDVKTILENAISKANEEKTKLSGKKPTESEADKPLITDIENLDNEGYNLLNAERQRLEMLSTGNKEQIKELSSKQSQEKTNLVSLDEKIEEASRAGEEIKKLTSDRKNVYKNIFSNLIKQKNILEELYHPLKENLEGGSDSLSKLKFYVRRVVDVKQWSEQGENLLDLRRAGSFRGEGALENAVKEEGVLSQWETGNASEVEEAMFNFLEKHKDDIMNSCPDRYSNNKTQWRKDISTWFFSTEHISIEYGIQYEGVDIQQLSPGNRGIVLLILYLTIDKEDVRPLIIDQPEENLDPKSIYDELVPMFKEARQRRQIIIVTHNANLVVNTDVDQVIVASCDTRQEGRLPDITYVSGSLENKEIRKEVCEILEGGKEAFQERAKRLRIIFRK